MVLCKVIRTGDELEKFSQFVAGGPTWQTSVDSGAGSHLQLRRASRARLGAVGPLRFAPDTCPSQRHGPSRRPKNCTHNPSPHASFRTPCERPPPIDSVGIWTQDGRGSQGIKAACPRETSIPSLALSGSETSTASPFPKRRRTWGAPGRTEPKETKSRSCRY